MIEVRVRKGSWTCSTCGGRGERNYDEAACLSDIWNELISSHEEVSPECRGTPELEVWNPDGTLVL